MAESIVSDLAVRVLESLGEAAFERIAPYFGGRDKLVELRQTMIMIQAGLSDAERRQEDDRSNLVKEWLRGLKRVLYRLEDLFEEVAVAEREQRSKSATASKLRKVVRFLPSKLNSLRMNKVVNQEFEGIMRQLNSLKADMGSLQLSEVNVADNPPALSQIASRETHSFIQEEQVIGRDKDKAFIIDMLLNSAHAGDVLQVISIFGMGGLGKTTLSQLVYNDQRVQQHFEYKYWVCISDDRSSFKELMGKVFRSITRDDGWQRMNTEELQSQLLQAVTGKQFLLVLDDVWDENMDKKRWVDLRGLLICKCKPGSKVLVTTRSEVVARNMGTVDPYKLDGLPKEKSWELFQRLAFGEGQEERNPNLTRIGREIVKKCGNVPLAIRTIAALLYARDTEQEWEHFRDKEIGMIDETQNDIIPTLKLSYNHLLPRQKQCFAYCSLFPKDYEFDIEDLKRCWMAQGFVKSSDDGHACFMELLRRCFFQDVQRDNDIDMIMVRCKMHDLMHDLAKNVGDECLTVDKSTENISFNIRHVGITIDESDLLDRQKALLLDASKQMRSLHLFGRRTFDLNLICSHFRKLRVLDLGRNRYEILPNSIGELKHLRYLNASTVLYLPKEITRLQNLQTLYVESTKELPSDFTKLTSLRHLKVNHQMDDMPPGFGKLNQLETLNCFIVGKNNGLDALSSLNLTGELRILFKENRHCPANFKDKKLTALELYVLVTEANDELLNCLSLPSTLLYLTVDGFKGVRLSWRMQDELPNIVRIDIADCPRLRHLPSLGRLPNLKTLELEGLEGLEYVEDGSGNRIEDFATGSSSSTTTATTYYPSLETLRLVSMPNLKRWSRIEDTDIDQQVEQCQQPRHYFPRLLALRLDSCPKLKTMPWSLFAAQNLEMKIVACEELDLWDAVNNDGVSFSTWQGLRGLRSLELRLSELESLPSGIASLTALRSLGIFRLRNLKSLPECIGHLTQLRRLTIEDCDNLEALPKSIRNLTALQTLKIRYSRQLERRCKPDGDDWPLIQHITHLDIGIDDE